MFGDGREYFLWCVSVEEVQLSPHVFRYLTTFTCIGGGGGGGGGGVLPMYMYTVTANNSLTNVVPRSNYVQPKSLNLPTIKALFRFLRKSRTTCMALIAI